MTRVAILGATGYTALELLRILLDHPHASVTVLTSRQEGSPHIHSVHPSLYGRLDLKCEDLPASAIAERADVVFGCLPHGASMAAVPDLLERGCKVVDLSADYRLNDPAVYAEWYGLTHTDPERTKTSIYGLPELFADKIRGADFIANPGCYTSTSILGLAPLLVRGLAEPTGIIIDAKSGVSGAGRSPKLTSHFPEVNESFVAYSVGRHRHTPEIEQVLSQASGSHVEVLFTPHLVPMDRGILATIYATPTQPMTDNELLEVYRDFYAGKPFVRIVDHIPATKDSAGTNFCDITLRVVRGKIVILACLDNLIKGASGVAIQNFNLMCGYPETMGLLPQGR
ncbi:MAG: N-acetyl-gamma-glutamyl-phosphate reductase [Planctomycetaceae bacterium]|nr:N-acetyl-gamma-glutamyl-phosphate reductase [Planctomycetaceae bacterium]